VRIPKRPEAWQSYDPNSRQAAFHAVPAVGPSMVKGFIGAYGGGKSTGIENEMGELIQRMPGGLSIAARVSKTRAHQSLIADFKRILQGVAVWKKNDEFFDFPNGHVLALMPCDSADRFGSVDLCMFFLQEAHEIVDSEIFSTLCARLRNPRGYVDGRPYYRGYIDARGITDKHWIFEKFIKQAWDYDSGPEKRYTAPNPDFVYMRSRTEDNRSNLREGYIEEMRRQHANEPLWQKVYIEGEVGIDTQGDAVFADSWDFDRNVADISEDTSLPILRGWDFGFRAPAIVWLQYTHSGRLLLLKEHCPRDLSTDELIQQGEAQQNKWWRNRPRHTYRDFGDIAGDQWNSAGVKDIEKVEEYFGTTVESRKARIEDGLNVMRKLMRDGVNVGQRNVPRFAVDRGCTTFIAACNGAYYYPKDKLDAPPKKGTGYDAVIDATRYVAQLVVEEGYVPMPQSPTNYHTRRNPGVYAGYRR
jgi:hypothetical protein